VTVRRLSLLAVVLLAACDGTVTVVGVLHDSYGTPVANARIALQNDVKASGADGCFRSFDIVSRRAQKLPLRIDAPGYGRVEVAVDAPGRVDLRIVLSQSGPTAAARVEPGVSGCK
jgi:hypothetical protein